MNVPALIKVGAKLSDFKEQDILALDAYEGTLTVNPDSKWQEQFKRRQEILKTRTS